MIGSLCLIGPKKKLIRYDKGISPICSRNVFNKTTRSGLKNYVLGPEKSDSLSKTTYIVLFPGLNS